MLPFEVISKLAREFDLPIYTIKESSHEVETEEDLRILAASIKNVRTLFQALYAKMIEVQSEFNANNVPFNNATLHASHLLTMPGVTQEQLMRVASICLLLKKVLEQNGMP